MEWKAPEILLPVATPSIFNFEEPTTPKLGHVSAVNLVFAGLLTGIGHTTVNGIANLWNVSTITHQQWTQTLNHIKPMVQQAAYKSINKARVEEMNHKENEFCVMEDACWNKRGLYPSMGCCSFVGFYLHKVVGIHILINHGKDKNFDGNAKSMQGEGTREICKIIAADNLKVSLFLHNGDASSFTIVKEYFEDCVEYRCANQASKNVGKWARNQFGKLWGNRIQGAFKHACKSAGKDPSIFTDYLEKMLSHWAGDHTACSHSDLEKEFEIFPVEQLQILKDYWNTYTYDASLFAHGSQSLAESWNHEISAAAPKDVHAASLYEIRILLAVLKHNEGPGCLFELLKQLEQPIAEEFLNPNILKQGELKRYQFMYHQVNPKKKKLNPIPTPSVHTYELEKDTNSSEYTCACKTGCKNNRCICKKNATRCNAACSCAKVCQNTSGPVQKC